MGIQELTDADFENAVNGQEWIMVDFWASWCGPCQMMHPVLEELAEQMEGKITFGKVNIDENPALSQKFGITSIPSFVILHHGEIRDQIVGAQSKEALKQRIAQAMQG